MKWIICKGGLGNQMFQYAFYVWMRKHHQCALDCSTFNYVEMHNGFELTKIFKLHPSKDRIIEIPRIVSRLVNRYTLPFVYQDQLQFDPSMFNRTCFIYKGDWQSEKWFAEVKSEVIDAFKFNNISQKSLLEVEKIHSTNSVSLHIRRGDYLNNAVYSNCATIEYYINAIKYVKERVCDCHFWIFSNDIEWCKEMLAPYIGQHVSYVDWNTGKNSYEDMYLMSQCKHNIIANSSFSWWGGFLNSNSDKIVIAPRKWFNTVHENHFKDIIPEKWVKL